MAVSTVDKELMKYFIQLNKPQKRYLLQMIKTFLKTEDKPEEKSTIEEYNRELDEAMDRITKGKFTTFEQLEKEMQTW